MKAADFVHLHCHSTFSLLEAVPTPEEIVARAVELKQTAVGLADKGYTYGLIQFYKAAKKAGIKPILGLETYVAARTRHDKESSNDTKRYPLVLLAETQQGYQNLLELATKAALEGMYYKPRVDAELLKQYGKGLIALTGPISGAIPQAALAEDMERITELTKLYQEWFGAENLYYELMDLPNVPGQAEVNQQLIKAAKELSVPLVATCNSHYCRQDDAEAHDVLLCIQKNNNVQDASRFTMRDSDFSMRPFEEMKDLFSHVPDALTNTRVIADRCSVNIPFGDYRIPQFPVGKGETEESLLRKLAEEGLKKRYEKSLQDKEKAKVITERFDYELGVIKNMGFSGYFLIVADFIAEAKKRGITVGPGRGSAAGSIVSYALDITTLDPLEHGLLFERFLNPERISMPDIDIDFADTRRDEVLDYVRGKYGADRVIQICTFGTLAARAAVKDVGRVYGVSFSEMNALAKLIPDRPGTTLEEALGTDELQAALKTNETYRKILEIAVKLEGKARHVSVHACGVVITPEPAVNYTALQRAPKSDDTIITQYDAKPLESLGLLKMDFLGLKNLTIIQTALLIIERLHKKKIDIANIPIDDKETFALLSRGETTGVFQLESGGMRRYLKQLKPTEFEDITAMVSLYRPGPMEKIPEYIKCKHGQKEVSYPHPDLEPILKPTYGVGIYQEQILEMARVFAGYTLGEADLLRRAIGKKIKKELDAQRDKFIKGAVKKGYTEKLAVTLFDDIITPFANYGFNKSHGACYARIAYETAYLKAHYPTEFMAALLSSENGDTDRIAIEIEEARSMGIQVLPPDINESLANFTALSDSRIRFGLLAIKGVGENSVRQIIELRERDGKFESIEDLARRVPSKLLNKKLLESLAKAGALDCLGDRAVFINQYTKIVDHSKATSDVSASQTDMFGTLGAKHAGAAIAFDDEAPLTPAEKLKYEKEALGLYVSSHPLAGLKKYIGKKARLIETLSKDDVGRKVTVAGMVESVKKLRTRKGEGMAVVTIEDPTGRMEAMFFPKYYSQFKDVLEDTGSMLVLAGTLDMRLGQPQLKAEAVKKASLETMVKKAKETGMFSDEEAKNWHAGKKRKEEEADDITEDAPADSPTEELLGPIAAWIQQGMQTDAPLKKLKLDKFELAEEQPTISVHTVTLPARAPKELLLAVKEVFETFPGREKVRLKIGSKLVDVPMTIAMSPILEKRIEEAVNKFSKQ